MHVLILTHYWPPEIGASSHLTHELGETLVELGNIVTVVTGMPSYNMARLPERYKRRFTFDEEMAGMRVLRVATGASHRSIGPTPTAPSRAASPASSRAGSRP